LRGTIPEAGVAGLLRSRASASAKVVDGLAMPEETGERRPMWTSSRL